jgi:excisionase family DNA binding protein
MQAYATPATGSAPQPQLRLVEGPHPTAIALPVGQGDVLQQFLGQLVELVADRVASRLAAPERDRERADQWLDSRRAAEYLGIGRDSIRRLAAEGSIPTEQAGAGCKLYFRRSDLDRWRSSATGPIEPLRGRRHG